MPGAAPYPETTPAPPEITTSTMEAKKPISLPSANQIKINTDHIMSGHSSGGNRGPNKDRFPDWMTQAAILKAIREAYRVAHKIGPQQIDPNGEVRQLLEGVYQNMRIQMWVNLTTKTIETAWPK